MARHLHALLQSSIVKRNTRSRTFWMQDDTDEDVNFNTSYIGKGIHTLMTRGLIIKTYTPPTFSKNSILPTPLQLDELKYKDPVHSPINPHPPLHLSQQLLKRSLRCFYLYLLEQHVSLFFPDLRRLSLCLSRARLSRCRQHSISSHVTDPFCKQCPHPSNGHVHIHSRLHSWLCPRL